MKNKPLIRLVQLAMLAAVSVVLVLLVHFPLIPSASFLQYDMADVPILVGSMLYGPLPGLLILLIVSVVQAFLLGGDSWYGLVMHMVASSVLVLLVSLFYRHKQRMAQGILGMALGTLGMAAVMIPMNLLLTPLYMGVSRQAVVSMLLPAIIPFNLLKAGLNCVLTALLFTALTPFLRKNRWLLGIDDKTAPNGG